MVVAADWVPPKFRCGDRQDAGAGAEVNQLSPRLARRLQLAEELEAEAGGRMGAGAEGLAGVDDDVDRALSGRLPGGAEPEAVGDQEGLVEVAPAVGPVVGNLGRADLDPTAADRGIEVAQLRQLALAAVDRVLDVAGPPLLLDAVRRQDRQLGQDEVRLLRRAAHREPDQPKALRTRENRPSPCRGARLPSSRLSSRRSAISRCSSLRLVGTKTLRMTRWLPRRRPLRRG